MGSIQADSRGTVHFSGEIGLHFSRTQILVRLTGAFCVAKNPQTSPKTPFSARFEAVYAPRILEGL